MKVIYEPSGRAREYSPLALNIYSHCVHGCKYCYANRLARMRGDNDYYSEPQPRAGLIEALRRELNREVPTSQVLLSFIGDCYGKSTDDNESTSEVVRLLSSFGVPFAVLTKSSRVLKDLDVFRMSNCMVGMTLTYFDEEKSRSEEPFAASPSERLATLKIIHEAGVKTFASFEPVIEPEESLRIMKASLPFVDLYKVGKLNGDKRASTINWSAFLKDALLILRSANKEIYVKDDLRASAPNVYVTEEESNADLHTVVPLEANTLFV